MSQNNNKSNKPIIPQNTQEPELYHWREIGKPPVPVGNLQMNLGLDVPVVKRSKYAEEDIGVDRKKRR